MRVCFPTLFTSNQQSFSLGNLKIASQLYDFDICLISFKSSDSVRKIVTSIIEKKPNVLGLGVYLWNRIAILQVIEQIKNMNASILIILGGPIITRIAHEDMLSFKSADFFIKGEGETSFKSIIELLHKNGGYTKSLRHKIAEIDGVYTIEDLYREKSIAIFDLKYTKPVYGDANTIFNINSKPSNWKFIWWETTRGCIFDCAFCDHDRLAKGFRYIPLDVLKIEFRSFVDNKTEFIYIVDPIFGGCPKNSKTILKMIAEFQHNIYIKAYIRGEFLDEEYLQLLKNAGFKELQIGIQSTNENIPGWIRNNDFSKLCKVLPLIRSFNIAWRAELIIGLPGDNIAGLRRSFKFLIEDCFPSTIRAYPLSILPGTLLEKSAAKNGRDWLIWNRESYEVSKSYSYTEEEYKRMKRLSNCYCSIFNSVNDKYKKLIEEHSLTKEYMFYNIFVMLEEDNVTHDDILYSSQKSNDFTIWKQLFKRYFALPNKIYDHRADNASR